MAIICQLLGAGGCREQRRGRYGLARTIDVEFKSHLRPLRLISNVYSDKEQPRQSLALSISSYIRAFSMDAHGLIFLASKPSSPA